VKKFLLPLSLTLALWCPLSNAAPNPQPSTKVTASTAGGHTSERTEHAEMVFVKDIDKVSPKAQRSLLDIIASLLGL
jgi:hypothetical protein